MMDSQPQYSEALLDHYRNPRNVGALSPADGTARRENQVCGDVLEIFVRLEGDTVKEARFRAEGCIPTVALASFATEWAVGRKATEAQRLDAVQLSAALGELPSHKQHAAQLVMETLRASIAASGH